MAIIKHISVHVSPLKFLRYIMSNDKTNDMKLATGLNCTPDTKSAHTEMRNVFEYYSGERFYMKSLKDSANMKERVRLHHYIQSFKPDEVTPEEAHRIGIEWAKKVFGENHQVLVTTHVNKSHIHNHFAVAAQDLDGKVWYDNKSTLKRCRDISDKICLAHGLSVIEKPKYRSNHKYADWLARNNGTSWKQKMCDDIDKLILQDNVKSVQDLAEQLRDKGYIVTLRKYLSIKAGKNKKAIRSLRLGDGYGIEELQYRIENKNQEMSLSAIALYQGIQREYALCLRELQIMVYRKPEINHNVTYGELRKDAELLTYLCDNNIQSSEDFENVVNQAAEKSDELKKKRNELILKIREEEKILEDGEKYLELNKINIPTSEQLIQLSKLSYLTKYKLRSQDDLDEHRRKVETLKSELSEIDIDLEAADKEKSNAAEKYRTYLRQIQSDYDFILEKMKREQDEIVQSEQEQLRERDRESQSQTINKYYR